MQYTKALKEVAKELNLEYTQVESIYKAYWKAIVTKLMELPFKQDLTEEEFNNLQTSINIPSLGKIYCTWQIYTNLQKKRIYVQKAKENKATKH